MLRNGVAYGTFVEWVRKAYVDIAFEQQPGSRKPTVSSVSTVTGLTRKEVKRLRETVEIGERDKASSYNRAVRVLGGWLNDAEFQSKAGQPAELAFEGEQGSFQALVKRYSGDIPASTLFSVLAGADCISLEQGKVRLLKKAYIPGNDPAEKLKILGADVAELIATIDHNLTSAEGALRFQRKVSNSCVDPAALPAFRRLSAEKSQQLLETLDQWLSDHEIDQRADADRRGQYLSVGIYYYEGTDVPGGCDE
jgi:hypothetical protein